jgi:hypothetical protein
MIEINLISEKKSLALPIILGIDFNQINLKLIIIAIVVSFLPDAIFKEDWIKEKEALEKRVEKVKKESPWVQIQIPCNRTKRTTIQRGAIFCI